MHVATLIYRPSGVLVHVATLIYRSSGVLVHVATLIYRPSGVLVRVAILPSFRCTRACCIFTVLQVYPCVLQLYRPSGVLLRVATSERSFKAFAPFVQIIFIY